MIHSNLWIIMSHHLVNYRNLGSQIPPFRVATPHFLVQFLFSSLLLNKKFFNLKNVTFLISWNSLWIDISVYKKIIQKNVTKYLDLGWWWACISSMWESPHFFIYREHQFCLEQRKKFCVSTLFLEYWTGSGEDYRTWVTGGS